VGLWALALNQSINEKYVIVSADKAPSNIVFVCKSHYKDCLITELGIDTLVGNPTYTPTTTGVNTGTPNTTQKTNYWTTPTPLQLGWTQVLRTLHRKHNIEQHQLHYNWDEHRCSKHYTENKILNNTNPTTTGVNTGNPNTTQKTQYWTTPTPLQLWWTRVLQTLHRKQYIEQHQPHYNCGEHRCSKHYTENNILNNTNPTTTGVNKGAPNTTQKTQYWTTPAPLQLGWTQVLQTLHRKHNVEQHPPHYNCGEHRCSKHYTENTILNNTHPTTTGVNTGALRCFCSTSEPFVLLIFYYKNNQSVSFWRTFLE
jgi:hypothetical protein